MPWLIAVQLFVLVPMLAFSVHVTNAMGDRAEARERQLLLDKATATASAMAREADRLRLDAQMLAGVPSASPRLELQGTGDISVALHALYRRYGALPSMLPTGEHLLAAARGGQRPERFGVVLREQVWPEGWVASLVDASGRILARTRDEERYRGQSATPQLRQKIAGGDRSVSSTVTVDGLKVLSTIAPVPGTAWWVAVGVPEETVDPHGLDPLVSLLGMGICLILLGLAASTLVARRLNREFGSGSSVAPVAPMPVFSAAPAAFVPTPEPLEPASSAGVIATATATSTATAAAIATTPVAEVAAPPGDATLDGSTGLPLPDFFLDQVRQARSVAENSPGFLWCAISIELGGIAAASDRLGDEAAERLLQAFVGRMRRSVRPGDACGRIGDDTFVIVLTGPRDGLAQAAERVGSSLVRGARALGHGLDCKVGYAIGDPARPVSAVLEQAAHARQEAGIDGSATRWFDVPG